VIDKIKDVAKISSELKLLSAWGRGKLKDEIWKLYPLYESGKQAEQALYFARLEEVFYNTAIKGGTCAEAIAFEVLEAQGLPIKEVPDIWDTLDVRGIIVSAVEAGDKHPSYLDGAMDQAIKRGYRNTIMANAERWARVPTGSYTCPWCVMLASRGFAYRSEDAAASANHNFCDCVMIPAPVSGEPSIEGYDPEKLYELYERGEGIGERPDRKEGHGISGNPLGGSGNDGSGNGGDGGSFERFDWSNKVDVNRGRIDGDVRVRVLGNNGEPNTELVSRHESFSMPGSKGLDVSTLQHGGQVEKDTAAWAVNNYGGDMALVRRERDMMTPDYIWSGEKWEQKTASSLNGIESRLEKAALQTDHGGVIINIDNYIGGELELLAKVGIEMRYQGLRVVIVQKGSGVVDILEKR